MWFLALLGSFVVKVGAISSNALSEELLPWRGVTFIFLCLQQSEGTCPLSNPFPLPYALRDSHLFSEMLNVIDYPWYRS